MMRSGFCGGEAPPPFPWNDGSCDVKSCPCGAPSPFPYLFPSRGKLIVLAAICGRFFFPSGNDPWKRICGVPSDGCGSCSENA